MSTRDAYRSELDALRRRFGANLRRIRTTGPQQLSQERLAYMTGLHRTEIGKLEQGVVEPKLTTILILADALQVSPDELLDGLCVPVERRPSPTG